MFYAIVATKVNLVNFKAMQLRPDKLKGLNLFYANLCVNPIIALFVGKF